MIQHARKHVMERKPRAFQEKFVDKEVCSRARSSVHVFLNYIMTLAYQTMFIITSVHNLERCNASTKQSYSGTSP